MFSTVTIVLLVSCCGAALSSWIPYGNSYSPEQGKGGYWNSYLPKYESYRPQQYPSYPGSYWPGPWPAQRTKLDELLVSWYAFFNFEVNGKWKKEQQAYYPD
ncbi:hypothetical protein DPMN_166393 [Dreissena polymorpha]|uniref:Uncharacterized protein n=1 Tax=Dreissena polymorpha TaxID=45954 RepID=A0A9D4EYJ4_DREPO|nr:hypothetical protein DPMN_166393 [Dreissena polymorpha]